MFLGSTLDGAVNKFCRARKLLKHRDLWPCAEIVPEPKKAENRRKRLNARWPPYKFDLCG
jgi:hypothetical protein